MTLQIFLSGDRRTRDESQDGDKANDQRESKENEKYSLAIRIVPDPSLEISDEYGATDQSGQHRGQCIDQKVGPERSAGSFCIGGKQYDLIIYGLADRKENPDACNPKDLLPLAARTEDFEKMSRFSRIRMAGAHGRRIDFKCGAKVTNQKEGP